MHSDEISRALDLLPKFHNNAGEPRVSPDGTALIGVYGETYWTFPVVSEGSANLIHAIEGSVSALEKHEPFLRDFVATGGEIEFFIGWFTTQVSGGDTLDWELLARLARLKINLSLDVYGNVADGTAELPDGT